MRLSTPLQYLLLSSAIGSNLFWTHVDSFSVGFPSCQRLTLGYKARTTLFLSDNADGGIDDASQMRKKAEELRDQVRNLEKKLQESDRPVVSPPKQEPEANQDDDIMSLNNKCVMVVGANGRVGSMVCRYLLRNCPAVGEVVAAVHTVSDNSRTNRGYGRLSYEVGAEDGRGNIGAAWAAEDERTASFEFDEDVMGGYNLDKLRLVEVELLDPVQCDTVTAGVDAVIFCATDFNGNVPRAVSGLNAAFLFRALASPKKGRVEVEGLRNILEGMTANRKNRNWDLQQITNGSSSSINTKGDKPEHMNMILISPAEEALGDFETPFGTFKDQKRQGENMVLNEFPSLTSCVLQFSLYEDNFVKENLDVVKDFETSRNVPTTNVEDEDKPYDKTKDKTRRRINRRDAARATAEALTDKTLVGKKVAMYTAIR